MRPQTRVRITFPKDNGRESRERTGDLRTRNFPSGGPPEECTVPTIRAGRRQGEKDQPRGDTFSINLARADAPRSVTVGEKRKGFFRGPFAIY